MKEVHHVFVEWWAEMFGRNKRIVDWKDRKWDSKRLGPTLWALSGNWRKMFYTAF